MSGKTTFLLLNPCIHDFTAYNLWMRPTGLMQLYGFLTDMGYEAYFLDSLFPTPGETEKYGLVWPESKKYHTGKFPEKRIEKPAPYKFVPRYYRRFGLPPDLLLKRLKTQPEPDCILVTSGMTYWYPGVQETVSILRDAFPNAAIILGGVYATLCTRHAESHSGADAVVSGSWQTALFEEDCRRVPQLCKEPLLQNPTVAPLWNFEPERYDRIKLFARNGLLP